jgi:hypothetical protein
VYSAETKVAMNRKLAPLVAVLLLLAFGVTARADLVYKVTTTVADPTLGPVNGFFSISNAALAAGVISAGAPSADITNYSLDASAAKAPFLPHVYTPADPSLFGALVLVPQTLSPVDGRFVAPFTGDIFFGWIDTGLPQSLELKITGPSSALLIGTKTGSPTSFTDQVLIQAVPEPSSMLLLATGGISGLAYCATRLRSRWRKGNL